MFTVKFYKVLVFVAFLSIGISLAATVKVSAAFPAGCLQPFGIPESCQSACTSQDESNCYVPDFQCSNSKLLNPLTSCCNNKCRTNGTVDPGTTPSALVTKLNFFGTQFSFYASSIPSLINIAISTFLGFVSAYALIRGMYIGAILRTRATSSEDIAKVNKEIINLVIGFILAWSFIFIIQFVASVLGIGKLQDLDVNNTGAEIVIK